MDFLEDLFDFGDRRRNKNKDGKDYRDDHDHDHDHDRKYNESAVTCAKCSKPVVSGAKFCPGCGAEITAEVHCVKCGTSLVLGAAFCHECGTKPK